MKLNMYSIYDTASGLYMRPFFMNADAAAIRTFGELATNKDHEVGKHPEDYSLFRIGIYDDNTAEIAVEKRECISTALERVSKGRNGERSLDLSTQRTVDGKEYVELPGSNQAN